MSAWWLVERLLWLGAGVLIGYWLALLRQGIEEGHKAYLKMLQIEEELHPEGGEDDRVQ